MTKPNLQSRMTPIDKECSLCDDVYVEFVVYSDFTKIADLVDFKPTKSQKQGDTMTNSLGKTRNAKLDLWTLSSDNQIASKDARDHLDFVLGKLYTNKDVILKLQENHKMYVSCVWFSAENIGGFAIWPEQMKLLTELNLEFSISFYPKDF